MKTWQIVLIRIAILMGGVVFWEAAVGLQWANSFWISSPSLIAVRFWEMACSGELWKHVGVTFGEALSGMFAGSVIGIFLGLLLGVSRHVGRIVEPFVIALNSLPRVALGPLIVMYVGIGFSSKFFLAVSLVVVPVMLNTYEGVRSVAQVHVNVLRTLGATRWQLFTRLLVPNCLPWIFSALRVAIAFAIIGAIVGEFISAKSGIGYLIDVAAGSFDTTGMLMPLLTLMAIAFALDRVILKVSDRLLRWRTLSLG